MHILMQSGNAIAAFRQRQHFTTRTLSLATRHLPQLAWRTVLYGSRDLPQREFHG